MPVDLISLSPHKFYGPKGVGILYVRAGIEIVPALTGGGHEEGRRSGTVNVPFAVGAAEAYRLAVEEMPQRRAHYEALRDRLIEGIPAAVPDDCIVTGHPTNRLPHNASFAFRHCSGNDLLIHLDMAGIAASSGSACKTGNPKPSAILQALGLGEEWTKGGLRLTVGQQNTLEEVEYVIETIASVVHKLQKLNLLFA
jgi:cysteine desulfurase